MFFYDMFHDASNSYLTLYHCLLFSREFLLEGLTILKNRGYDSMGIATMSGKAEDGLVSNFCLGLLSIVAGVLSLVLHNFSI